MKKMTFGDMESIDTTGKEYCVLVGSNLGHRTLKMNLSISQLVDMSRVYNVKNMREDEHLTPEQQADLVAQRPLYESHAKKLARFMIIGLADMEIKRREKNGEEASPYIQALMDKLGRSEYSALQPIVANIRNCAPEGADLEISHPTELRANGDKKPMLEVIRVTLYGVHILSIVDGQHRLFAFHMVQEWLQKICTTGHYPKKGLFDLSTDDKFGGITPQVMELWRSLLDRSLNTATLCVEVHLGANVSQERQLFVDLNTKVKPADIEQSLAFDRTDPVNIFVKDKLIDDLILRTDRFTLKQLKDITATVITGSAQTAKLTPEFVQQRQSLAEKFWTTVQKSPHFYDSNADEHTLIVHPVMLKAIAFLAYQLAFVKKHRDQDGLTKLWLAIESGEIDFSHNNLHWQALVKPANEWDETVPGMTKYVAPSKGKPLNAGEYDPSTGKVLLGTNTNDIRPRLSDLLRMQLKLRSRH